MTVQINPLEILHVDSKKVSCAGEKVEGIAGEGHPQVYLDMGKNDFVVCPYCSKYFSLIDSKNSLNLSNKNKKN
jgi:hypothetical protein